MHTIGDQLGPYRLVYKLGRGSFGTVWLAERKTSVAQTTVAVKIPIDEELDSKLFEQESQLWALASGHPNVLPIIEADVIDGQLLIVSEYAADGSLDDLLKGKEENFSTSESVEIISNILGGLQHLHSKGIIHRDLKPGNILFQGRIPRLGDFGISRLTPRLRIAMALQVHPFIWRPRLLTANGMNKRIYGLLESSFTNY